MVETIEPQTSEGRHVDDSPSPNRSLWRSPWLWLALVLIAAAIVAVVLISGGGGESAESTAPPNTAEVVRTDLVDESTFEGTLGRPQPESVPAGLNGTLTAIEDTGVTVDTGSTLFRVGNAPVTLMMGDVPAFRDLSLGDTRLSIPAGRSGTITHIAAEGAVASNGAVAFEVDEFPIVVLEGSLPMYRVLRNGVEGEDVQQLEEALVALGFDPDGDVTIDEEFTSATRDMVERWQESLGVDETGVVSPGDVIFTSLPAQVLTHQAPLGAVVTASTPVLDASGGDPLSGSDVDQLEESLVTLGFDPGRVDGVYDIDTATAVAAWTDTLNTDSPGWIPLGSVVFLSEPARIAEHIVPVGATVTEQTAVLTATPQEIVVKMDLPAEDQEVLSVGTPVTIVLPDRTETPGTVTSVASVATNSPESGLATFEVEIAVDDPSVVGELDEAPVDIDVVSDSVEDVLAVPVSALLALAEGGYAVEVVEGGGTRLVAVEPGFFGGGLVEIEGSIEAGTTVVVP